MRLPLIAGNWKMYKTVHETEQFFREFLPLVANSTHCEIAIAPPFTSIAKAVEMTRGSNVSISSQNVFWEKQGAYTGEVSAAMLVDAGCRYAIIGHSERRQYFGETNQTVNKRIMAALAAGLEAIVCVGELLAEREGGKTESVLKQQLEQGLVGLTAAEFARIIIAYEPVWAIGTGRTATPEIAEDAHRFIRSVVAEKIGPDATTVRILYGGSVKPDNVKGLMAQADIDGGLVGGASLEAKSFAALVNYTES
jgi:triosephosphate isomerase (TIM)